MDMSITVGWNAAVKAGVTREEMDEWALGSHRKAIQAIDEGRFKEEIVPDRHARTASSTSTSTRAATRRWRSSRR